MACGSADTEGGSPKASQAINDSFPPYSSINKQVVEVNPGEAVIFTWWNFVLPEIVTEEFNVSNI